MRFSDPGAEPTLINNDVRRAIASPARRTDEACPCSHDPEKGLRRCRARKDNRGAVSREYRGGHHDAEQLQPHPGEVRCGEFYIFMTVPYFSSHALFRGAGPGVFDRLWAPTNGLGRVDRPGARRQGARGDLGAAGGDGRLPPAIVTGCSRGWHVPEEIGPVVGRRDPRRRVLFPAP